MGVHAHSSAKWQIFSKDFGLIKGANNVSSNQLGILEFQETWTPLDKLSIVFDECVTLLQSCFAVKVQKWSLDLETLPDLRLTWG